MKIEQKKTESDTLGTRPYRGLVADTYDQFIARIELKATRDLLRKASNHPAADRYARELLNSPFRGAERMTLANYADAHVCETFVATVAGRGFNGRQRTVMLQDLRLFGCKFILEAHLWFPCCKLWARVEPFYQGEQVVLVGTAVAYTRKNGTSDFTLALDHVTKLWMPTNNAASSGNQSSLNVPLSGVSDARATI